ncbi:serine hydrolase domain-containing protein [Emticicia sp. C21]|uniref:serine hydrolase domain-containing protein n=1 Tax=Emticicia sp. C21 TaxID=2302915 RepID=UPI000E344F68|nr:serine hydrolase domain-containing protein [Emticicia sp. C21]RFS15838.1 serine hydrolase [Emticicia sp. C21]
MKLCLSIVKVCFYLSAIFILNTSHAQDKSNEIDQYIEKYVNNDLFNGSVLVVQNDKTVFQKSYGFANKEWGIANNADTKFRIGSITKQFTAMLIMQLEQEGKLSLQEKITTYLPWYPKENGDKITIHHLLTHESGLPNYTESADAMNDINTHDYSPEEIAKKYCIGHLRFEPGTKFEYCNTGYFLLGLIIETLTKKPYAEVIQEKILNPAGMKNTGMDNPKQLVLNRASGYAYGFDGYTNADYINPATATYAAGGLYATPQDLYLWQKALYGDKLLAKENRELMFTPNLGNYGYGLYIVKTKADTIIGHNGGLQGFSSSMLHFSKDKITVIIFDNTRVDKRGNLENITAGIVNILQNKQPAPFIKSMQIAMIKQIEKSSGEGLVALYKQLKVEKASYEFSRPESFLNNLGYHLLQHNRLKDAVAFLKFTTEEYPESANAFDSYAEALVKYGQKETAIQMYRRSLELNPKNSNAEAQLKLLEQQTK